MAGGTGGIPSGEGERHIGDGGSLKRSSNICQGGLEGAASQGGCASDVSPAVGEGLQWLALEGRNPVGSKPSARPGGGVVLGLSLGDGRWWY